MRSDIVAFIEKAHRLLGINAYYIPDGDIYVVTKNGKAVQNFTSFHFYQQPKHFRLREWRGIIKLGINQNMGEASVKEQIKQTMSYGKRII